MTTAHRRTFYVLPKSERDGSLLEHLSRLINQAKEEGFAKLIGFLSPEDGEVFLGELAEQLSKSRDLIVTSGTEPGHIGTCFFVEFYEGWNSRIEAREKMERKNGRTLERYIEEAMSCLQIVDNETTGFPVFMDFNWETCWEMGHPPKEAVEIWRKARTLPDVTGMLQKIVRETLGQNYEAHVSQEKRAENWALLIDLVTELKLEWELKEGYDGDDLRRACLRYGIRGTMPRVIGFYPVWLGTVKTGPELKHESRLTEQERALWQYAKDNTFDVPAV